MYADDPEGGTISIRTMVSQINKLLHPIAMQIIARGGPGSEYRLIIGGE